MVMAHDYYLCVINLSSVLSLVVVLYWSNRRVHYCLVLGVCVSGFHWYRVVKVSQVYESIQLSRLVELAPLTTTTELERVVVETACSNNIQVRHLTYYSICLLVFLFMRRSVLTIGHSPSVLALI